MRTFIVASSLVALFLMGSNAKAEGLYDHLGGSSTSSGGRSSAAKGTTPSGQPCDLTSQAAVAPAPRPQVVAAPARVNPPVVAPTPVPAPATEDKAKEAKDDKKLEPTSKGDVAKGELVFARCIECHKGQKAELQLDSKSSQEKIDVISGVAGKPDMKARAKLSEQETADLKAFLEAQK